MTLTYRSVKGSALSHNQLDENFRHLDSRFYGTRAGLVSMVASGRTYSNGDIVTADGLKYKWSSGSTDIPDLPGLIPATSHVDLMHWGADNTSTVNSQSAFKSAFAYLKSRAVSVGAAHFKPSPGTYLVKWDGATGYGSGTGLNERCSLLLEDADNITIDLSGLKIVMGGSNRDEWATFAKFYDCNNVEIVGGTLDYENEPYTQGTITAMDTGAATPYVDITIESGYEPSFTSANWLVKFNADREPVAFGAYVDSFTETPWSITSLGSGVYRVTGFTAGNLTTLNASFTVGTLVSLWAIKDAVKWFQFVGGSNHTVRDVTCHCSIDLVAQAKNARGFYATGNKLIPPPGRAPLLINTRGGFMASVSGGDVSFVDNTIRYVGDDGLAISNDVISDCTYVSSTSFTGFSANFYWFTDYPNGTKFQVTDANGTQVCTFTLVSSAAGPSTYYRTFTVTIDSGALPNPMTSHVCDVIGDSYRITCTGNRISNVRGCGIYGVAEMGVISDNVIEKLSGQGIAVTGWNSATNNSNSGIVNSLAITNNIVKKFCLDTQYAFGIYVWPKRQDTTNSTMSSYAWDEVNISNNIVSDSANGAIMAAGVDFCKIAQNVISNVGATGGNDGAIGVGANSVIYVRASRDVMVDGNIGRSLNGRSFVVTASVDNVISGFNFDMDAASGFGILGNLGIGTQAPSQALHVYNASGSVRGLIQSGTTNNAILELKNTDADWLIFINSFGMFFQKDGTNFWNMSASGHFVSDADQTYDIGSTSSRMRNVYSMKYAMIDGITAPSNVSGLAFLFIDSADTRPKLVRSGGSVMGLDNGGYSTVSTDADATWAVFTQGRNIRHTGTLTADRTITLSTTGATSGDFFHITRTGSGAFNLSIGGLKNLATDTWCRVAYNGSAWYLAGYGSL